VRKRMCTVVKLALLLVACVSLLLIFFIVRSMNEHTRSEAPDELCFEEGFLEAPPGQPPREEAKRMAAAGSVDQDRDLDPQIRDGALRASMELAKLAALIREADRIVVSQNRAKNAKVFFTSTARKDIEEFGRAATIATPVHGLACLCTGSPSVRLFRGAEELLEIASHHGTTIRFGELWLGDASLKDPERWFRWFASRGIPIRRGEGQRPAEPLS